MERTFDIVRVRENMLSEPVKKSVEYKKFIDLVQKGNDTAVVRNRGVLVVTKKVKTN